MIDFSSRDRPVFSISPGISKMSSKFSIKFYLIENDFMFNIPPEIWEEILEFLQPSELKKMSQISHFLREIIGLNKNFKMMLFLYLNDVWDDHSPLNTFFRSCVNNHLEASQWLYSTFNFTTESISSSMRVIMMEQLIFKGHFRVLQWLHSTFNLIKNTQKYNILLEACRNGDLEIAKWSHSISNFTREDIVGDWTCRPLQIACNNGHTEVAKWLYFTFDLTGCIDVFNLTFQIDCINDYKGVIKWLETLGLQKKKKVVFYAL